MQWWHLSSFGHLSTSTVTIRESIIFFFADMVPLWPQTVTFFSHSQKYRLALRPPTVTTHWQWPTCFQYNIPHNIICGTAARWNMWDQGRQIEDYDSSQWSWFHRFVPDITKLHFNLWFNGGMFLSQSGLFFIDWFQYMPHANQRGGSPSSVIDSERAQLRERESPRERERNLQILCHSGGLEEDLNNLVGLVINMYLVHPLFHFSYDCTILNHHEASETLTLRNSK